MSETGKAPGAETEVQDTRAWPALVQAVLTPLKLAALVALVVGAPLALIARTLPDSQKFAAVLRLLGTGRDVAALELRGKVLGCDLQSREALASALNAEPIAIEHGHVQRAPVEAQVHRLQIDDEMPMTVQLRKERSDVCGQRHLGPQSRRQP
jgi:hypothetical protein